MPTCQTLIRAGILITQNQEREIIEDAAIAIGNGAIAHVGPWQGSEWTGSEFLDLADMLVMPGLINSHSHGAMTFLRGLADDQPLMDWLTGTVFPVEARLVPEIVYLGSMLGFAEMLATGTTGAVDMYLFEEQVFRAADKIGIRCLGGEAIFGFPSAACRNYQEALEATAELARRYRNHERLAVAVNPHSVYTTDETMLAACRDLALANDLPLHIHLAETATETGECLAKHGLRPVSLCERLGLLETRLIAAHLVDITDDEIDLLAQTRVTGSHNPSSNMKLASGVAPVARMLARGMTVGLGTDGPASNNQLNMFAEMSHAALLQKVATHDPATLPAQTVLDMATLGGAKALGRDDLGRISKGCRADLIALSIDGPNMQPFYNPVSQAVYAASGHEVRLTMVSGEILYHDGKFSRIDYPALLSEAGRLRRFALSGK